MILQKKITIISTLVIFSVLCHAAAADTILVVTEDNFRPYNYTEKGNITGIATQAVRAVLDESGIDYSIQVYPWPRAYKMTETRENVLIYSIIRNPKREPLFKWIGPIAPPVTNGLFKLKYRTDIKIRELEDAKQYIIGSLADSSLQQFLLKNGFHIGIQLQVVIDTKLNLEKLFAQRVDLIIASTFHIHQYAKSIGKTPEDVELAYIFEKSQIYMAFSRSTPDRIVDRVSRAFYKLNNSGRLQEIYDSIKF